MQHQDDTLKRQLQQTFELIVKITSLSTLEKLIFFHSFIFSLYFQLIANELWRACARHFTGDWRSSTSTRIRSKKLRSYQSCCKSIVWFSLGKCLRTTLLKRLMNETQCCGTSKKCQLVLTLSLALVGGTT